MHFVPGSKNIPPDLRGQLVRFPRVHRDASQSPDRCQQVRSSPTPQPEKRTDLRLHPMPIGAICIVTRCRLRLSFHHFWEVGSSSDRCPATSLQLRIHPLLMQCAIIKGQTFLFTCLESGNPEHTLSTNQQSSLVVRWLEGQTQWSSCNVLMRRSSAAMPSFGACSGSPKL